MGGYTSKCLLERYRTRSPWSAAEEGPCSISFQQDITSAGGTTSAEHQKSRRAEHALRRDDIRQALARGSACRLRGACTRWQSEYPGQLHHWSDGRIPPPAPCRCPVQGARLLDRCPSPTPRIPAQR